MILLTLLTGVLFSCSFEDEPGLCPYNVRLEYHYAGAPDVDNLSVYTDLLCQYIFGESGTLLRTDTLTGEGISEWKGTLDAGRYTVVTWGNPGAEQQFVSMRPGETLLKESGLSAVIEGAPREGRGNTSRLYFGYHVLDVSSGESLRRKLYMTHAHASLHITVRWDTGLTPPPPGRFSLRLRGIPAEYAYTPGMEIPLSNADGAYTMPLTGFLHTNHSVRATLNYENEVVGEFVTFRYTAATHPMLSLYREGQQVMKELDLERFFRKLPVSLDENTEQEFNLLVLIQKDKITVSEMGATDWEEGGGLG